MFTYWAIKKYLQKLLPELAKQYGDKKYFSAQEVRTTVYQGNFHPRFLPLAYMLALNEQALASTMAEEFPNVNVAEYKNMMRHYLCSKKYKDQQHNIYTRLAC